MKGILDEVKRNVTKVRCAQRKKLHSIFDVKLISCCKKYIINVNVIYSLHRFRLKISDANFEWTNTLTAYTTAKTPPVINCTAFYQYTRLIKLHSVVGVLSEL